MSPRTIRLSRFAFCPAMVLLATVFIGSQALADPIYSITDLGTLNGQTSSVATGINNLGQVVGISYNSSDGYFTDSWYGSANPPRYTQTGSGAESFLYSNGQMNQISPTGGLAMSINNSGQVVGGQYSSINDLGQYAGGQNAGIQTDNPNTTSVIVSGGATTTLPPLFLPYSINNAGQVAGYEIINEHGGTDAHPAIYQNGQLADLFSKVAGGEYYDSRAVAINQRGDIVITVSPPDNSIHSYLYNAGTGVATELPQVAGGNGLLASALNNKDQVVGVGFLYNDGMTEALTSLINSNSGWSNLVATGINDLGQIVGQGTIDGQERAFEMSPIAMEAPEPATLLTWGLICGAAAVRYTSLRSSRKIGNSSPGRTRPERCRS